MPERLCGEPSDVYPESLRNGDYSIPAPGNPPASRASLHPHLAPPQGEPKADQPKEQGPASPQLTMLILCQCVLSPLPSVGRALEQFLGSSPHLTPGQK
jgi:hypothetical protein